MRSASSLRRSRGLFRPSTLSVKEAHRIPSFPKGFSTSLGQSTQSSQAATAHTTSQTHSPFSIQCRGLSQNSRRTAPSDPTGEYQSLRSEAGATAAKAQVLTQKPPSYYDLFPHTLPRGPPPNGPFEIDLRALKREFLKLQAAAHPDFHHAAASSTDTSPTHSAARAQAEAASSYINEVYKTLSSPLLRAQYLLREKGMDLANDEAGTIGAPDPEMLLTVLEAREEIEAAESEEDLEEVRLTNEERIRESEEALSAAFKADDIETAARQAVRLRYWINVGDSVRGWEKGKGIVLEH